MKINKKLLKDIVENKISTDVINIPFVIIRDQVHNPLIIDKVSWEYTFVYSPKIKWDNTIEKEVIIDRETALKLIKLYNMKIAINKTYGQIYEMPGNPFLQKFQNKKRKRNNANTHLRVTA